MAEIVAEHCSGLHTVSPAELRTALVTQLADKPDVFSTTEMMSEARAAVLSEVPGYALARVRGTGGRDECAVLVRRDRFRIIASRAVRLSEQVVPRRKVHDWALVVVLEDVDTGRRHTRIIVHRPSGVQGARGLRDNAQGDCYRDGTVRLVELADSIVGPLVITGDWNLNLRLEWVRAYLRRHFPDFAPTWPKGGLPETGTHGRRVIDFSIVRGFGVVEGEVVSANGSSDHRGIREIHRPKEAPMARTYLEEHPPRIRQFRWPRRATPSGVVVVHTAESQPDEVGPDTGAENVARFIQGRTTYGSYHDLADSDSIVHLVAYDAEAYGDGTGSNPHAYHVSAATQAHRWPTLSEEWRDACVRNMARAAARYARWIREQHGVVIPARRITRDQSEARVPGFLSHGQRDPDRRTDPGKDFPWEDFLTYFAAEMDGAAPRPDREDWFSMATKEDLAEELVAAWQKDDVVPAPSHWPEDNKGTSPASALKHVWQNSIDARADARAALAAVTALAGALDALAPGIAEQVTVAVEKALAEGIEVTVKAGGDGE